MIVEASAETVKANEALFIPSLLKITEAFLYYHHLIFYFLTIYLHLISYHRY